MKAITPVFRARLPALLTALAAVASTASTASNLLAGLEVMRDGEEAAIEHPATGFATTFKWDSLYASEGRDNLGDASISSLLVSVELDKWLLGTWLAHSGEANYEERNFFMERRIEFAGFEGYAGYNFLQFPGAANKEDSELGAGLSGPELPLGLVPEFDWYYSLDAGGSYAELGLSREIVVTDQFHLSPSLRLGRNDGYITDGHHGADHLRLTIEAFYRLRGNVTIQAHLGENFAINSSGVLAGDELLRDFFHGGIGVTVSF